jgi:2-polyprenyl-3-methyl-5-hydroxy-6-metoxy-1,4-benzoquinol methylase
LQQIDKLPHALAEGLTRVSAEEWQDNMNGRNASKRLTTVEHWDRAWGKPPRARLPSSLNPWVADLKRLLGNRFPNGGSALEIGCAPGKLLLWLAVERRARVSGIDYSPVGVAHTNHLFAAVGASIDLRQEDVFETSFRPETFDLVYSMGVIEHFSDPTGIVRKHIELTKRGGRTVITIPNYGGIFGRVQRMLDPENLAIHNTNIMSPSALRELVPADLGCTTIRAYPFGRIASINSWHNLPLAPIARLVPYGIAALAHLQPCTVKPLCPALVLDITR